MWLLPEFQGSCSLGKITSANNPFSSFRHSAIASKLCDFFIIKDKGGSVHVVHFDQYTIQVITPTHDCITTSPPIQGQLIQGDACLGLGNIAISFPVKPYIKGFYCAIT